MRLIEAIIKPFKLDEVREALNELGVFGKEPIRKVMASLGREVLYDFLRDQGNCMFFYRRLNAYVIVPPMALTRNDQQDSDVVSSPALT